MAEELETALRYRHRAEEIRQIAEETKDPKMRATLFSVAADYEKMANTLERIAGPEMPPRI